MKPFRGYSNCNMRAVQEHRAGRASWLCVKKSDYSEIFWTGAWWWSPIKVIGRGLEFIAWHALHFAFMLSEGAWLHVSWIDAITGEHWEYVPNGEKRKKYVPPMLFKGVDRRVRPSTTQENERRLAAEDRRSKA